MKKHYLKIIYDTLKFIFKNFIIYGIIVGIISGLIVTFLFYTPKMSVTNTIVKIEDDKHHFSFLYENKGQSPAIDIEYITKYAILYKNEERYNEVLPQHEQEKFETGDILVHSFEIDFKKARSDIFEIYENSEIIILSKVKYEDGNKFRNFINNRLLKIKYSIYRLSFYDVLKKEKGLSLWPLEKRNEFKEMIDRWIEE